MECVLCGKGAATVKLERNSVNAQRLSLLGGSLNPLKQKDVSTEKATPTSLGLNIKVVEPEIEQEDEADSGWEDSD